MSNVAKSAPQTPEADGLSLRYIVDEWRTADQERKYHSKAHQEARKFDQLIKVAKDVVEKQESGHSGSERLRWARRMLFWAQILEAQDQLASLRKEEDAFEVWRSGRTSIVTLVDALAEYVDAPKAPDWTADRLTRLLAGRS